MRLSNPDGAARDFKDYVAFKPEDIEGWLEWGDAELARAGEMRGEAALAAFLRAEQVDATDFRVPLGMARARMAQKDWKKALERLEAADLAAKHASADVYLERAVCRVALGRHAPSLRDYSSALPLLERRLENKRRSRAPAPAIDEEQALLAKTYYSRGRVLDFLVRSGEALVDYQQACDLGHKDACTRLKLLRDAEPKPQLEPPAAENEVRAPQEEAPKPKRRRRSKISDDSGDRIYGL